MATPKKIIELIKLWNSLGLPAILDKRSFSRGGKSVYSLPTKLPLSHVSPRLIEKTIQTVFPQIKRTKALKTVDKGVYLMFEHDFSKITDTTYLDSAPKWISIDTLYGMIHVDF